MWLQINSQPFLLCRCCIHLLKLLDSPVQKPFEGKLAPSILHAFLPAEVIMIHTASESGNRDMVLKHDKYGAYSTKSHDGIGKQSSGSIPAPVWKATENLQVGNSCLAVTVAANKLSVWPHLNRGALFNLSSRFVANVASSDAVR